jgi:hypothetical protein
MNGSRASDIAEAPPISEYSLADIPTDAQTAAHRDTTLKEPARHSPLGGWRAHPRGRRPGPADWIPESFPLPRYPDDLGDEDDPLASDLLGARPYDVRELMRLFDVGAAEMAMMTRRSERSVWRWVSGRCPPKGLARNRLAWLQRIAWYLEWSIGPDAIKVWVRSPNEGIHGRVPLELMMADRALAVAGFLAGCRNPYPHPDYGRRRVATSEPEAETAQRSSALR